MFLLLQCNCLVVARQIVSFNLIQFGISARRKPVLATMKRRIERFSIILKPFGMSVQCFQIGRDDLTLTNGLGSYGSYYTQWVWRLVTGLYRVFRVGSWACAMRFPVHEIPRFNAMRRGGGGTPETFR